MKLFNLDIVRDEMVEAKPIFQQLSPSFTGLFLGTVGKVVRGADWTIGLTRSLRAGDPIESIIGDEIGGRVTGKIASPVSNKVEQAHLAMPHMRRDWKRKNGLGGRSWITKPGRHKMVMVFHDANRAGPHIDVHIGRLSVIYRVKPELYAQLKYNRQGMLTENSRKLLIEHVRSEVANGSRVPQNLDHSQRNARASWVDGDTDAKYYGSGKTRQVFSETTVDVYKAHADGPIEMYAPVINPHRGTYLYQLYPGDNKRAPILIWGNKSHQPPKLEDRLHLKLAHPEDIDKVGTKVDMKTSTAKYDGASMYFVITPKGTTAWSPRLSTKTNERIEYTYKLGDIAHVTSDETIIGMGELLFVEKQKPGQRIKGPKYLSAAETGGILNSDAVVPDNLRAEVRLYRIDRVGRKRTKDLSFWENRELQKRTASLHPDLFKVVELMPPDKAKKQGFEGFVAVPKDASVNDGYKVKWWDDANDWRIDSVEFKPGDKGGIAGVVHCTSLDSGKKFKLGPGQVGTRDVTEAMMAEPKSYEGTVLKVHSRQGHEGRAAKVIMEHPDKGTAPF
ncbi:MAG TPA: hypothetical protein VJ742_12610 [Nitrososphaera sp.]|nr:hypothetical protein [Nitrososphaera sp.]